MMRDPWNGVYSSIQRIFAAATRLHASSAGVTTPTSYQSVYAVCYLPYRLGILLLHLGILDLLQSMMAIFRLAV
jgi:hypothetical protein